MWVDLYNLFWTAPALRLADTPDIAHILQAANCWLHVLSTPEMPPGKLYKVMLADLLPTVGLDAPPEIPGLCL